MAYPRSVVAALLLLASAPQGGIFVLARSVDAPERSSSVLMDDVEARIRRAASFFGEVATLDAAGDRRVLERDLRDCRANAACFAARIGRENIAKGVFVVVDQTVEPPLLTAELIDVTTEKSVRAFVELRPEVKIEEMVRKLFTDAGGEAWGRVVVETEPIATPVDIAGARVDRERPGAYFVPPGRVEIHARHADFEDADAEVEVRAFEDAKVALTLDPRTSIVESPWLWIGVAAGALAVAGGSVAIYYGVRTADTFHFVRPEP
jgi:hypothetical protein